MQATGSHEKVNTNNILTCLNSTNTMSKNLVSLFSIMKYTLTSFDDFFFMFDIHSSSPYFIQK